MISDLVEILEHKKILILGFGKEGISSYQLLRKHLPASQISIADQREKLDVDFDIDPGVKLYLGSFYLENLADFDLIIKTPGVPKKILQDRVAQEKVISQTDLFLRIFSDRIIGVTGTKGKSTTSSLIKHILSAFSKNVVLVGNIGVPPFDLVDMIDEKTWIVFELSSHQLQDVSNSPHIAVLLNLFEEHLDHYDDLNAYHSAKMNIAKFQKETDWLILNDDDKNIKGLLSEQNPKGNILPYSLYKSLSKGAFHIKDDIVSFKDDQQESLFDTSGRNSMAGDHNLMNIMAAICVCKIIGLPDATITEAINNFKGLRHRLEYVGLYKGIHFYNDSIATIPEATISAIKTLKKVDTLIVGGKDRGIEYKDLIDYLPVSGVNNIIFTGDAGKRIKQDLMNVGKLQEQKLFFIHDFNELSEIIKENTSEGSICLLSPAASSYDMFRNFEERGDMFKKIAENL